MVNGSQGPGWALKRGDVFWDFKSAGRSDLVGRAPAWMPS